MRWTYRDRVYTRQRMESFKWTCQVYHGKVKTMSRNFFHSKAFSTVVVVKALPSRFKYISTGRKCSGAKHHHKYCCTVVYMNFTVLKNIVAQPMNMLVLELMFLYWEIDIFFNWSCYLCTKNGNGVYIFVLKLTFLYLDTYWCTGVYFIVLVNILALPMNMFVY